MNTGMEGKNRESPEGQPLLQRTVGQLRSAFDNNTTLRSLVSRNMTLNEWTQSWENALVGKQLSVQV